MFDRIVGFLQRFDWILFLLIVVLTVVGLASIYGIDLSRSDRLIFFPTQLLAFGLGTGALFVLSVFHKTFYERYAKFFYIGIILILIAVLFFGAEIRGTRGWFRVFGLSFQPAELAKLVLILYLSYFITKQRRRFDRWQYVLFSGIVTFIPVMLILLQPDLGSALVLLGIWFGVLLLTRTKKRYVLGIVCLGLLSFAAGWLFLFQDYQKERLLTFVDPARDPLGSGYNVTQSVIAVGSGQIFGRGLGFGSQSQLRFLPEAQSDFIFSVIAEELGLIGVTLVLGLYAGILWRIFALTALCKDDFSAFVLLGSLLYFLTQMSVNIGAAIGVMPLTGIPLPFLSYGGSSLIINFGLIGIIQSVVITNKKLGSYL